MSTRERPERWKHVKTGGIYRIVGSGRMEADGEAGVKYIMYRNTDTGLTWIRPAREFFDGRFELMEWDGVTYT